MIVNLKLNIEPDDVVILPGRAPMKVVEVNGTTGGIVLYDAERAVDVTINLYAIVKGLITVERTQTYVLTP